MKPTNRQLRGRVTGDVEDVQHFYAALNAYAKANNWDATFIDGPVSFGEHGPIHKVTFGFTNR